MAKKERNVMALLLNPGFDREESSGSSQENGSTSEVVHLVSPSHEQPLRVDIFYLSPYDKNPRKAENEKYADIKESIRQVGLEHQFSITKRQEDDHYIIRSGGNTRLKALKELYNETQEERFRYIDCRFVPYTDDLDLLSLHMLENELRGRMLFIDTAMAVREFRELLQNEFSTQPTQTVIVEEMKKRGWKIQQPHFGIYIYSCDISEYLSEAFANGLGRRIVEKIRQLENHLVKWAKETNKDERRTLQYFRNVLKENDAPAINLNYIEESTIARLASEFSLNAKEVKISLKLIKSEGTLLPLEDETKEAYEDEVNLSPSAISGSTGKYGEHGSQTINPEHEAISSGSPQLSMPQDFPLSPENEAKGLSPEATKQLLNKTRHQLKDLLKNILYSVKDFNSIFKGNSEDTLFDIEVYPKQMLDHHGNLMTEKVPPGDAAFFFAILMRLLIVHATVTFKDDPEQSQKMMKEFLTASAWQLELSQPISSPSNVISIASSILPEHFQHRLIGFLSKEVNQGFNQLPLLDLKIKEYLRFFE